MPSFPRRRESCLAPNNFLRNKILLRFRQDSRLRGGSVADLRKLMTVVVVSPKQPESPNKGRKPKQRQPENGNSRFQAAFGFAFESGVQAGRSAGFCRRTVIQLGAPLPVCSSNLPERSAGRVCAFCLVLLRMGFGLLRLVAKCTVRSYRTFSPLPVPPFQAAIGGFAFCSTFRRVAAPGR